MKTLVDQLANYAAYHRDHRNLVTHLVGIPMIVLAIATLAARPAIDAGVVALSPALVAGFAIVAFYLRLDVRFGLAMAVFIGACVAIGQQLAAMPTAAWLAWGVGLFVVGWIVQFVGHHYEGRKPAFVDDLVGLAIGPLFIVAEVAFMLKLRLAVRDAVERRVGPMRPAPHGAGQRAG